MNNHKNKVWMISAAVVFAITILVTAGLLIKVVGLDILPANYLALFIFGVVFLLFIIMFFFFFLKKNVIRIISMVLAVVLMVVDVAGILMINKFEDTMSELLDDSDAAVKVEEYIIGIYVLAEDKAASLEDVKRYDLGYSLAYDRNNTKKAINLMENELDRKLNLEEFNDVFEMVDKVLAGELRGFVLSSDYLDVLVDQEGYEDIADKIKCVHECKVTVETEVAEVEEEDFDVTKDTFIVYISGHDTPMATKRANSDVNILAVVNPSTKQVLLINSPRDSYVPISVSPEGELDKLTHCGVYGVECSMDTLNDLYDIDIRYYAQLNFTGFTYLVDAVGGISVYSEKTIETHDGYTFVEGINELNGEQALRFVRERKLYGGDRIRGRHQMEVIKGLIAKMSSGALLRNYGAILDSMGQYFKWNLPQEDVMDLVKMQLSDKAEWNIQMYAITGTGDNKTSYSLPNLSTYVMIMDPATIDHAKTLINMVYEGEEIEDEDLILPSERK